MENMKIRVKSGIVVDVNDNGDTITVNVEDQNFIEKLFNLYDKIEKASNDVNSEAEKVLNEREQLNAIIEKTKDIMADIDDLFGENACLKIFGDIVPNPYLIADFLDQLTPITEQYMDERQKKIMQRYNRGRKGNKHRTKEEIIRDAMR